MPKARTLSSDELQVVLDYIATQKHAARNRCALLMTHWAGMRVGETSALTIADVLDATGKVRSQIYLTPDKTKGKHARTVFINSRLQTEIAEYLPAETMRCFIRRNAPNAGSHQTRWQITLKQFT
jgi:integrase/recombinase XerD